ncbi:MAG: hypothetical protein E7617_08240 [Ruminococcaceae bacterium]|nr:hypothetical protein [Oscillospiraceae bacterium]
MTHEELIELIKERLDEAEALIGKCKNGDKIVITKNICYLNDDIEESTEWDPDKDMTVLGEMYVRLPGRCGEDDPHVSFAIAFDYTDGKFDTDEEITEEYMAFDGEVDMFLKRLSSADDIEAFVSSEHERQKKEVELAAMDFDRMLRKFKIYSWIGVAVAIVITVIITLAGIRRHS